MRYKTNLEAIQSVALSLLYTPIHERKFSPMVVQHSFTSSAFVAIKNKGKREMFNILENTDNVRKWHRFMENLNFDANVSKYELVKFSKQPIPKL